jgi:hypothetical protein
VTIAFDGAVVGAHIGILFATITAELALLVAVHHRVRRLGRYFDRAAV